MMNRKKFIKVMGGSCVALSVAPLLLTGCTPVHRIHLLVLDKTITVPKDEFMEIKKGEKRMRDLVLVNTTMLGFPIALYRNAPDDYTALWMECTHQSCELKAHGKYLDCPCHGSEFDAKGKVTRGPAENDLRTFKTTTDDENVYIRL